MDWKIFLGLADRQYIGILFPNWLRPGSNDGFAWDWWIDIGVQYWQIVGILIQDCQLIVVLTMDWQRIDMGPMCECRIGELLQTNSGISHGQTLDWE